MFFKNYLVVLLELVLLYSSQQESEFIFSFFGTEKIIDNSF